MGFRVGFKTCFPMRQLRNSSALATTDAQGNTMQWETVPDQWIWICAAVIFVIFVGVFAGYSFYKRKPNERTKSDAATRDGWTATGRIDFVDPLAKGDYILHVEETRIVNSMGGVEHREIRWRRATLDEAKTVVVSYHAQRNLAMTASFIVSSSSMMKRTADPRDEDQKNQLEKSGAADATSNGGAKIAATTTELITDGTNSKSLHSL